MLYLKFQTEGKYYLIESLCIAEVTHFVEITKQAGADNEAGEFNYRGELIPAVDFKMLLTGRKSEPLLSTRIAVINTETNEDKSLFGLIVERAVETVYFDEKDFKPPAVKNLPFLGSVVLKDNIVYQKILPKKIFPTKQDIFLEKREEQ